MALIRSLLFTLLALQLTACQNFKPLPEGVSFEGAKHPAHNVEFLADITYTDDEGTRNVEQEIFDEVFDIISEAERLILVDMFLFTDFQGPGPENTRPLSGELVTALIEQKRRHPTMEVIVISDPVNTVYGGLISSHFENLEAAGVDLVITDLNKLHDSNPVYSFFWRLFIKPFGNSPGSALPNPIGQGRVSVRSYLSLFNFKANHRKVLLADSGNELIGMVTSANPHDGSSAHGNVALKFSGGAVSDLLESENAVLSFSGSERADTKAISNTQTSSITVQVLTENRIKESILQSLAVANQGDSIDIAMFYLSDRDIILALKQARQRNVSIRILLDPNKDAFGRKKNGIPGRPVAAELATSGIPVRWCDTHGEQCHAKMLIGSYQNGESILFIGSANFTRRNLDDLNLETDVAVRGPNSKAVFTEAKAYFEQVWNNTPGRNFSVDYSEFEDDSVLKKWQYRFMEASGISAF